jgi:hypothetical protein
MILNYPSNPTGLTARVGGSTEEQRDDRREATNLRNISNAPSPCKNPFRVGQSG